MRLRRKTLYIGSYRYIFIKFPLQRKNGCKNGDLML